MGLNLTAAESEMHYAIWAPARVGVSVCSHRPLLADSTRSRMSASSILIRPQTNVGNRHPRVNPEPSPDDNSQRGTRWRLGTTARSRTSSRETLWLELADAVSARGKSGAGDGNRTHV